MKLRQAAIAAVVVPSLVSIPAELASASVSTTAVSRLVAQQGVGRANMIPDNSGLHCNKSVCTSVVGRGDYISTWYTGGSVTPRTCNPIAKFYLASIGVTASYRVSGCRSYSFFSKTIYPYHSTSWSYTTACNSWAANPGIPGRPCVSIHP